MNIEFEGLDEIAQRIAGFRQDLAAYPEIGPDVSRTAAKVVEQLEQTSLRVRAHAGFPEQSAMGVVADLQVMSAQRTIALVADMSAQSVRVEGVTSGRASRCSHVAGNDAHTAMLVGTAQLLHRADVSHNVRFVFQSGGEMLSDGAQSMLRDGALSDVDEVYAVHLWPGLESGRVGLHPGPIMSSLDRFHLRVRGERDIRPWPHRKVDSIRIAAAIVRELDELNKADNDQSSGRSALRCVVTHFLAAQVEDGDPPDEVHVEGDIRALSDEERQHASERLGEIAERCATEQGGSVRLTVKERGNVTINDAGAVDSARSRLSRVLGPEQLGNVEATAFSTGLSGYLEQIPGAVVPLGCGGETNEPASLLLSPAFSFDDSCLSLGIRVLAGLAGG